jgi:hypothetical protein
MSYDSLQNFRPISLGSNLAKILEKIILGRLNWHARDCDWLSEEQHGFLAGKATETATHSLTSFVENGFSIKHFSVAAFLDIKSAFDSAWHPAIIAALSKRSCPQYLLKIVSSFLATAVQFYLIMVRHLKREWKLDAQKAVYFRRSYGTL